jgi:hypothetical protein
VLLLSSGKRNPKRHSGQRQARTQRGSGMGARNELGGRAPASPQVSTSAAPARHNRARSPRGAWAGHVRRPGARGRPSARGGPGMASGVRV